MAARESLRPTLAGRVVTWSPAPAVLFMLVLALLAAGCGGGGAGAGMETITIKGHTFEVEVARDEAAIQMGMMHRGSIDEAGGMLFVFPDAETRSFWMGNCLVDIDIIFLDPQGRVTATHRMKAESPRADNESEAAYDARMPRYSSAYPAQFAIELRSGWLDRLQLRVEDKIPLDLDRLKRLPR
jgi:uncharacterized membrane protein (UPF0127 family)